MALDAVYEHLPFQVSFAGLEGIEAWVGITAGTTPDAHVEVLDAFRAGNQVEVRGTLSGTPLQLGPGPGKGFSVPVATLIEMGATASPASLTPTTSPTSGGRWACPRAPGRRRPCRGRGAGD